MEASRSEEKMLRFGAIRFLFYYFCMNCIEKKKKNLFHFTSANCLLFVLTLSGKGKTQSFLSRYLCPAGFPQ